MKKGTGQGSDLINLVANLASLKYTPFYYLWSPTIQHDKEVMPMGYPTKIQKVKRPTQINHSM